jgi:hypothetical protein
MGDMEKNEIKKLSYNFQRLNFHNFSFPYFLPPFLLLSMQTCIA